MSDGAPRLASLSVLGGPLHGKRVDLAGVDEVTIGADPDCSLVVELPGVSPLHAKVWVDLEGAKVIDTRSPSGVFVNMERVEGEKALREGDTVWLGPPEAPGSVLLQCRFERGAKSDAEPLALSADAFHAAPPAPAPAPPPSAPAAAPPASEFVVAGFEAQWPETGAAPKAPGPASAEEDPFFIGEGAPASAPPPPAAAKEESFFMDDFAAPAPAAPAPAPPAPAPPPPAPPPAAAAPLAAPVDEFFFEAQEKPVVPAFASFVEEAPFEIKPLTDVGVPKPAIPGARPAAEAPAPPPPAPPPPPVPPAAPPPSPAAAPAPAPAPPPPTTVPAMPAVTA